MVVVDALLGLGQKLLDIINTKVKDDAVRKQLSLELQKTYFTEIAKIQSDLLKSRRDIIVSEATGHSWLQRNWRPITMLTFVFIIANNYILVPYGQALGLHIPILNLPDQVWELIKYGLTGYIGARSIEKIYSTHVSAKTLLQAKQSLEKAFNTKDSNHKNDSKNTDKTPKVTDFSLDEDYVSKL